MPFSRAAAGAPVRRVGSGATNAPAAGNALCATTDPTAQNEKCTDSAAHGIVHGHVQVRLHGNKTAVLLDFALKSNLLAHPDYKRADLAIDPWASAAPVAT
jgi:hypothetical protein